MPMPSLSTVCKVMCLPTAGAAMQMLAIGVGLLAADADQMQMVTFWSTLAGVTIPTKLFFGFIAVGKLIGTAALWGYLPKVWRLGSLTPMACAAWMHAQDVPLGSAAMAPFPAVLAAAVLYTIYADPEDGMKKKKKA